MSKEKAAHSRLAVPLKLSLNLDLVQLSADSFQELVDWQTFKQLAELLRAIKLRPPLTLGTGKARFVVCKHALGCCGFT
jgi:hypothetical protein